jgi:hypothetical protein
VDGKPFVVRGILHWGYYPELGHPWPDDVQIRSEIDHLKSLGFNLIKFCLWIPPPRYYEICDELEMLVWQEYPVWNAPLGGNSEDDAWIVREFEEFFLNDCRHPCVILRTLTCENDRVSARTGRALVDLAHELIPGSLVLENSGWLCNERYGDFHDEHPYVHNALWPHYGRRMDRKLTRPLLLGETMVADSLNREHAAHLAAQQPANDGGQLNDETYLATSLRDSYRESLAMRRFQIETLAREMPDVGYVICALRDLKHTPLGLMTYDGTPKYAPQDWRWHREPLAPPRAIPPAAREAPQAADSAILPRRGAIPGPRKGMWKCSENTWWSPIVRVLDPSLPVELIQRQANFDLLSGRVLTHAEGTRVLVEQWDVHSGTPRRNPLVIEFRSQGRWQIASAFRHDSDAGLELWDALAARINNPSIEPPPEIGPLAGTALVLDSWEMSLPDWPSSITFEPPPLNWDAVVRAEAPDWTHVRCDTPLVNEGRTIFEGWALFRARFDYLGGSRILRCESVADYFELFIDGQRLAEYGPRHGTWDGTRDIARDIPVDLAPGAHTIVFCVRDWRAAGGMVGPVFFASDLSERVL